MLKNEDENEKNKEARSAHQTPKIELLWHLHNETSNILIRNKDGYYSEEKTFISLLSKLREDKIATHLFSANEIFKSEKSSPSLIELLNLNK